MTDEQVKSVLTHPEKVLVLVAISYVNLKDREQDVLILRYMRGHTQEEVAEELDRSVNTIQTWEHAAIEKCRVAWRRLELIKEMIRTAQE